MPVNTGDWLRRAADQEQPITKTWPPKKGRERLPQFPAASGAQPENPNATCWSEEGDYNSVHPGAPNKPERTYFRGNFSGVSVPGFKNGVYPLDRSLFMTTEEFPTFSPEDQELILNHYVNVCGYTHIALGRQQAINWGVSLEQFIECALRCQKFGLFLVAVCVSDGDSFSAALPWLEAMLSAGALVPGKDIITVAWQVDKWYNEQDTVRLIVDGGEWAHDHKLLNTVHWGGGYPGWSENCACWNETTESLWGIHDRFSFQKELSPFLDGHLGQCNTEASIDEKQSWIAKATVAFPDGMFFVAAETNAQGRFDDPIGRPEVWCDMDGYLCTAMDGRIRVSYLNGARKPDGTVL